MKIKNVTIAGGGILGSPSGLVLDAKTPNCGPKMTRGDKTSPLPESLNLLIGELEIRSVEIKTSTRVWTETHN